MSSFFSTIINKLDSKGRTSVPAAFRAAVRTQGFKGVYCYPSLTHEAIEGGGQLFINSVQDMLEEIPPYSDDRDALATALLANSHPLTFDSDGRISLPATLLAHAKIDKEVAFVGLGTKFQIWNPERFALYRDKATVTARERRSLMATVNRASHILTSADAARTKK